MKRRISSSPIEYGNYEGMSSDPLAGSSASLQQAIFSAGGTDTGGLGITIGEVTNWTLDQAFKTDNLINKLNVDKIDPPKKNKYKGSLQSSYGEKVYSLEEWHNVYKTSTYGEIITEAGFKQGLPAGPKMRYVRNPISGNVMDMRHVSVLGYGMGNTAGDIVEHIQYYTGDFSNSAYDIQDYYSNKIGAQFYQLRHSGNWSSNSWAYDFKRFILTQYRTLQPTIEINFPK